MTADFWTCFVNHNYWKNCRQSDTHIHMTTVTVICLRLFGGFIINICAVINYVPINNIVKYISSFF